MYFRSSLRQNQTNRRPKQVGDKLFKMLSHSSARHRLTKFVHGMAVLFIERKFHEDADGWTDLMLHRRRH